MRLNDAPLLIAAVAIGALVTIAGQLNGVPELVWVFKPLTTILLAWAAWYRGRLADRYARFVFFGLVLSTIGDVLLINPDLFVAGLAAFLVAHLAYVWAFCSELPLGRRWRELAIAAVIGLVLGRIIWPGLSSGLHIPVALYIAAIVVMVGQAHARSAHLRGAAKRLSHSATLAATGATFFMISDGVLAINRFHVEVPWSSFWILSTYWGAQTLLALSVPEVSPTRPHTDER